MSNQQAKPTLTVGHEPQAPRNPAPAQSAKGPAMQGEELPPAPRPPQAAPPQDRCDTTRPAMTVPNPLVNPYVFWAAVAGIAPEHLIFPPGPSPLRRRCTRWLENHPRIGAGAARIVRLWRIVWFGPRHPDPAPLPLTPLNLAPWTNQRLAGPEALSDGSRLSRFRDLLFWHLSHPATRFESHAWRCKTRADAQLAWRLRTLRNTLAGRPSGQPPWVDAPLSAPALPPEKSGNNRARPPS